MGTTVPADRRESFWRTIARMLENFGDVPFYPARVPAETVAAMTAVALEVRPARLDRGDHLKL